MAKAKLSVTLDPAKVTLARQLVESATVSQLLDVALDRLIAEELDRRHEAGYLGQPPAADEEAWAEIERNPREVADEVDWARLYGLSQPR